MPDPQRPPSEPEALRVDRVALRGAISDLDAQESEAPEVDVVALIAEARSWADGFLLPLETPRYLRALAAALEAERERVSIAAGDLAKDARRRADHDYLQDDRGGSEPSTAELLADLGAALDAAEIEKAHLTKVATEYQEALQAEREARRTERETVDAGLRRIVAMDYPQALVHVLRIARDLLERP